MVKDIEKRDNEIIRVTLQNYRDHEYMDIRQYYKNDKGEFLPTKKGVTFNPELLDEIIKALQSFKE